MEKTRLTAAASVHEQIRKVEAAAQRFPCRILHIIIFTFKTAFCTHVQKPMGSPYKSFHGNYEDVKNENS